MRISSLGKLNLNLKSLVCKSTLILFTEYNGTGQPVVSTLNASVVAGGKCQMTDAEPRMPFIAHWLSVIKESQVSTELVDFSDFLLTLCEFAVSESRLSFVSTAIVSHPCYGVRIIGPENGFIAGTQKTEKEISRKRHATSNISCIVGVVFTILLRTFLRKVRLPIFTKITESPGSASRSTRSIPSEWE